ncbi:hypothetical protein EYZ11_004352 [Aspergillus tanneri]|uniref:Cytochrome P450-dit2 n=1 Tax=Aspergillus tanneri TaxID=1220188 RepID=A0A4S3JKS2_9EURO|nr:hypothetical protein EYZ11_004352 [Aspergillus tanneri]
MIWTLILGLLAVYFITLIFQLIHNIRLVKTTGLPYTWFPISEFSIPLISVFSTNLVPYIVNWLPAGLADVLNDCTVNYRWMVKDRLSKKRGSVHLVATPTSISCHVGDAEVISQICSQRQSFPKPVWQYDLLELYGPNVLTCEDKQWVHHRRHTASTFNENSNHLVWRVTVQQALEMIEYWREEHATDPSGERVLLTAAKTDILKLTLNVICGAGYGVSLPFRPAIRASLTDELEAHFNDTDTPPAGFSFTFRQVMEHMNTYLNQVILANMMLPKWITHTFKPLFGKNVLIYEDLGRYLEAMIKTTKVGKNVVYTNNLLHGITMSQQKEDKLTDAEIRGNLHIFTVAGHETTATTLRFALVLLSVHPDIQEWTYECIKEATGDQSSNPKDWEYSVIFPRLVAPLCVMLETMRLYPPVVSIPKWTGESSATITHKGKTYSLPPKLNINLNANALHYSEEYWGPDVSSFNPHRWDKSNPDSFLAQNDGKSGLSGPGIEFNSIHKPLRGAFIPFSDGFRACVGKRFAQVEFVAALSVILKTVAQGYQ